MAARLRVGRLYNPEHHSYDLNPEDITELRRRGGVIASWVGPDRPRALRFEFGDRVEKKADTKRRHDEPFAI